MQSSSSTDPLRLRPARGRRVLAMPGQSHRALPILPKLGEYPRRSAGGITPACHDSWLIVNPLWDRRPVRTIIGIRDNQVYAIDVMDNELQIIADTLAVLEQDLQRDAARPCFGVED